MERSYFLTVKEAFATQHQVSLERLGVECQKGGNQQWQAVNCPVCADASGSASIAKTTGFLNCHQCGRKQDLFEWWREKHGLADDWAACKHMAEQLGVTLKAPRKAGKPIRMTPVVLERTIHNLLEDPEAGSIRAMLKDRKLFEPRMLAELGMGFLNGDLIFAQFEPNGTLKTRFRSHNPQVKPPWRWSRGSGPPNGFWPFKDLPPDAEILLCEGEMDAATALMRMNLQRRDKPIYAFTWTGGASNPVVSSLMPTSWKGRKIWICYDNDVFQGPDLKTHRAPDENKLRDLKRRRENLINGVGARFKANGCEVRFIAIPIDPIDEWGADLRDWVNKGGTFDKLPSWDFDEIGDLEEDPAEISHEAVFTAAGQFITTKGAVATIQKHTITVPSESRLVCPMGSKAACSNCGAPKNFPDGRIDWKLRRGELLAALMSKDPIDEIIKRTVGKPPSCTEWSIEHEVYTSGSHWTVGPGADEEGDGLATFAVVSTKPPSLSGDVKITGYAHHVEGSVGVFATDIEHLDKPEVELSHYHQDLLPITPRGSNDLTLIDGHIDRMVHDLTHNVTKIYGRPELHIVTMLVAHSALWFNVDGHKVRGWLDACTFGDTRKGKSETIKRLFAHWDLGTHFTCMENFSRAGLTVGGVEGGSGIKPGLWPKNNRKMIFLDEFHFMEGVMPHLQSARDAGEVGALKVYGDFKLKAAVRLITAGNWSHRSRRHFQFACQHLLSFYGVPESLSRMDFAWSVYGDAKMVPEEVDHHWNAELSRALILRAWSMTEDQVHISPEALELAQQQCVDWDEFYSSDEIPLHTGIEKNLSILRIAIAIANIGYSHPEGKPDECEVRVVHVQWAIAWILRCWKNLEYDTYSKRVMQSQVVTQPYHVEAAFTVWLGLQDPDHALAVLNRIMEANTLRSLMGFILGNGQVDDQRQFSRWFGMLQRHSAFQERRSTNDYNSTFLPTTGALVILQSLMNLAEHDVDEYANRYVKLKTWFDSADSKTGNPGIAPLDQPEPESFLDDVPF